MFSWFLVKSLLFTSKVFLFFDVWFTEAGRFKMSVLMVSLQVIQGWISVFVVLTPPSWYSLHRFCITEKFNGQIPEDLKPAMMFAGFFMIPSTHACDVIATESFLEKEVVACSTMYLSIVLFKMVLKGLKTEISKVWMRWVEFDGNNTRMILSSMAFKIISSL